jgi:hypothetical protein
MMELYYYIGLVALLIVGWFALNATTMSGHVLERHARWIILGFFMILILVRFLHDRYSYD